MLDVLAELTSGARGPPGPARSQPRRDFSKTRADPGMKYLLCCEIIHGTGDEPVVCKDVELLE